MLYMYYIIVIYIHTKVCVYIYIVWSIESIELGLAARTCCYATTIKQWQPEHFKHMPNRQYPERNISGVSVQQRTLYGIIKHNLVQYGIR